MSGSLALSSATVWEFYRSEKELTKSRRRAEQWLVPTIQRLIKPSPTTNVLCVGCGNAVDVLVLREHGYISYGMDADSNCHSGVKGLAFVNCDACHLPAASGKFDVTVSLEVIEHVGTPPGCWKPTAESRKVREKFVAELVRVTKPGGTIILATPNRLFPFDEHGPGKSQIRWHGPFRDATLSFPEVKALFERHSCRIGVIDYGEYFALEKIEHLTNQKFIQCIKALFPILSCPIIHASPLNPHLFAYFRREV
jgi:SAM-dependent methyltransferase